jgi:hypothetical protein
MNSRRKLDDGRFLGERGTRMKASPRNLTRERRGLFRPRRRMHDPLLVLNMSIFNFDDGWNRTFNPLKIHENDT